jgi:LysR family glycine cleavage system transcriptional activator
LQAFVVAARAGNLTRAATQLNLTVSALSHQLKKLEDRLGRRLFERGPRGVTLTPEGQRLVDAIGPHIEGIERALGNLRVRAGDSLTVTTLPSMASSWLIPRLGGFSALHPEVQLSFHSSVGVVDFEAEPIDAAVRFGPGQWPNVIAEHLFDDWLTPVASPELLERHGRPTLETLGDWPLLGDPSDRWRIWFARFGGVAPKRYVASFNDSEMLLRAAAEGIGIALGRMTLAQALVDAGRVVTLTECRLKSDFSHYLVYPPRSADHPGLKSFRAWLLDEAKLYAQRIGAFCADTQQGKIEFARTLAKR